jgi:hypothetical protein
VSAFGIFGGGLGVTSTIPGECWDQAGFKACHADAYRVAQLECQNQGRNNDDCIAPRADQITMQGCKCVRKTAAPKPVTTSFSPSSSRGEALEPSTATIFGMDMKMALFIGAGVLAYFYMSDDKKKG